MTPNNDKDWSLLFWAIVLISLSIGLHYIYESEVEFQADYEKQFEDKK